MVAVRELFPQSRGYKAPAISVVVESPHKKPEAQEDFWKQDRDLLESYQRLEKAYTFIGEPAPTEWWMPKLKTVDAKQNTIYALGIPARYVNPLHELVDNWGKIDKGESDIYYNGVNRPTTALHAYGVKVADVAEKFVRFDELVFFQDSGSTLEFAQEILRELYRIGPNSRNGYSSSTSHPTGTFGLRM